jgi:hypothetical protein
MYTVLVSGDRDWTDTELTLQRLLTLPIDTVLVHGGAPGLDLIAAEIGKYLGFTIYKEPAKWKLYGRAAGPIRNERMYDIYKPDILLAFHGNIARSRGTKHMVKYVLPTNTPIELFTGTEIITDRNRLNTLVQ